jgi:hypothetical protein
MPSSACFDILAYWKEISRKSPTPARITCDILSIPITTVASEPTFSIGARVLNKHRSSMKDESVQALLWARSWLYGLEGKLIKVLIFFKFLIINQKNYIVILSTNFFFLL